MRNWLHRLAFPRWTLRAIALAACLFAIAPGEASAQACGNPAQRACCLFEAPVGACVAGAGEISGCSGSCGCGFVSASSSCVAATPYGGLGQRACCVGESNACQSGLVQLPQANSGQCGNFAPGIRA